MFSFLAKDYQELPNIDEVLNKLNNHSNNEMKDILKKNKAYCKSIAVAQFVLKRTYSDTVDFFRMFDGHVRDNPDVIKTALSRDGQCLYLLSRFYKDNVDYVQMAINQNYKAYAYASKKVQHLPEVIQNLFKQSEFINYWTKDSEFESNVALFKSVPDSFYLSNPNVTKQFLQRFPFFFEHLPSSFKEDKDFVLNILSKNGILYKHVSGILKKDVDVITIALKSRYKAFYDLPKEMSVNFNIVKLFIEEGYKQNQGADEVHDRIVKLLNKSNFNNSRFELVKHAIQQHGFFFSKVKEIKDISIQEGTKLNEDLFLEAIKQKSFVLDLISMNHEKFPKLLSHKVLSFVFQYDLCSLYQNICVEPKDKIFGSFMDDGFGVKTGSKEEKELMNIHLNIDHLYALLEEIVKEKSQNDLMETYKNIVTNPFNHFQWIGASFGSREKFQKFFNNEMVDILLNSMTLDTLESVQQLKHHSFFLPLGLKVKDVYVKKNVNNINKEEPDNVKKKNRKIVFGN
jgi:hypothetical protein